jgi:hypothetical protein
MADQRIPSLSVHLHAEALGDFPHAGKAEIVARIGILRLRVAEADYYELFSNQLLTYFKSE